MTLFTMSIKQHKERKWGETLWQFNRENMVIFSYAINAEKVSMVFAFGMSALLVMNIPVFSAARQKDFISG